MFRGIDPRDYTVATFGPNGPPQTGDLPELNATVHRLATNWRNPEGARSDYPLPWVRSLRHFALEIVRRARLLSDVVRSDGCGAMMVTSSAGPDLAAGLIASRIARIPFFVYMLDNWRYVISQDRALRPFAGPLQRIVLSGSRAVFVPNEWLASELERQSGCRCVVVANPVDHMKLVSAPLPGPSWPSTAGEVRIVYTGQVYAAQADSFARLIHALDSHRLDAVSLHVYSGNVDGAVFATSIPGRVVIHDYVTPASIHEVQRHADILFLPLAFASPYPEIIRTAAPAKLGEYLASGRPILIHAPAESYPAMLARRDGIAELVDQPAAELLVESIVRLMDRPDVRALYVRNARSTAEILYSAEATTDRFAVALQTLLA